jgi:endonuclease/exonuclease/phosphatase family metal-dependent hydrolase
MSTSQAPSISGRSKRAIAGGIAALAGLACVLAPTTASARSSVPGTPTGLHVVHVSRSSFTVKANAAASHYRLFASTVRGNLATDKLSSVHQSKLTKRPILTLSKLHYTTKPFYYRVEALNGSKRSFSATMGSVGLQPETPTNVQATGNASGTSISWDAGSVTGYQITQATDAAMTQDVHTYTTSGEDQEFTPYGLDDGTTYYFQVSALNGATTSPPSPVVSAVAMTAEQPVSVMTYNVLEVTADGQSEGGNQVAPWSQRRAGVANFINSASPDVVSIQEGSSWVGPTGTERQVDDIQSELNNVYSLADTETPPYMKHYFRTGCYILYKTDEYDAIGGGGHWSITDNRWAAYQILKNTTTGAQFLFVAPHLTVDKGGNTDQNREDETQSMVEQATAYAAANGNVPIIYAGDFNSDEASTHTFNGPSDYMLGNGVDDAFDAAQSRTNAQYDTSNQYMTTPPAYAQRIDYVFAPAGIAVKSWSQLLNLTPNGQVDGVIPSDHNPVVANLLVPYEPSS